VSRTPAEYRRRPPPDARHEYRELGARPVHEADGGARKMDAVPLERGARPPRTLRPPVRGTIRRIRKNGGGRKDLRGKNSGDRPVEGNAEHAVRNRAPVDHVQG